MSQSPGSDLGARLSEKELCPEDLLRLQEEAFARDVAKLIARKSQFVKVVCPACGTDRPKFWVEKFECRYNRCPKCSTVYMSPRPSPALMRNYYETSENYEIWGKYIFPASEAVRREKIHEPWLARILDYCRRYNVPTGRLVEVGPGFGTFGQVAIQSGQFSEVIGIEPTPPMAAACRSRGIDVREMPIEDVAEPLNADLLVAFEVLEHLFDPAAFVRQTWRHLKPGGLVVLSCPNGLGFEVQTLGSASLTLDTEHVNLFNPISLSMLLTDSGFEVEECTTPGRLDTEFVRDAVRTKGMPLHNALLKRALLDQWDELGWPLQELVAERGWSTHMWVVARRANA